VSIAERAIKHICLVGNNRPEVQEMTAKDLIRLC
jgi:hypothetical protein